MRLLLLSGVCLMGVFVAACNSQRQVQKNPSVLDVPAAEPSAEPAAGRMGPSIPPEYPPEDVDPTPPDEIPAQQPVQTPPDAM
jgi:hypothetical protein